METSATNTRHHHKHDDGPTTILSSSDDDGRRSSRGGDVGFFPFSPPHILSLCSATFPSPTHSSSSTVGSTSAAVAADYCYSEVAGASTPKTTSVPPLVVSSQSWTCLAPIVSLVKKYLHWNQPPRRRSTKDVVEGMMSTMATFRL
jgi:hypothetical protein